jgi:hypothetical protein
MSNVRDWGYLDAVVVVFCRRREGAITFEGKEKSLMWGEAYSKGQQSISWQGTRRAKSNRLSLATLLLALTLALVHSVSIFAILRCEPSRSRQ